MKFEVVDAPTKPNVFIDSPRTTSNWTLAPLHVTSTRSVAIAVAEKAVGVQTGGPLMLLEAYAGLKYLEPEYDAFRSETEPCNVIRPTPRASPETPDGESGTVSD